MTILELDDENSMTLYELDHDKNKKQQIMNLIPIIRKYFSFSSIRGLRNLEQVKRPYLSIIRFITKLKSSKLFM